MSFAIVVLFGFEGFGFRGVQGPMGAGFGWGLGFRAQGNRVLRWSGMGLGLRP